MSDEVREALTNRSKLNEENVLADRKVIETYKASQESIDSCELSPGKRRDIENQTCPICFDEMSPKEDIEYCRACGNNLHKQCWNMWAQQKRRNNESVTCVLCRTINLGIVTKDDLKGDEGYINLGKLQGLNTERPEYEPYNPYAYWRYRRWRYDDE